MPRKTMSPAGTPSPLPPPPPPAQVEFKSRPGERLHLVGNLPAFGSWSLDKSLALK